MGTEQQTLTVEFLSEEGKFTRESLLIFSEMYPSLRTELDEKGNLILMPPTSIDSSENSGIFYGELYVWNNQHGNPGRIYDATGGFTLPDNSVRCPDGAWIENIRIEALDKSERKKLGKIVPDLVAEVRSENDQFKDTYEKCQMWLSQGVKEVWCIDPGVKIIVMNKQEERSFEGDQMATSKLLDSFAIKVSKFYH